MVDIKPFLSLVVPLYNESRRIKYLEDGLFQFLAAKSFPIEVVMVDDGSDDDTKSKLDDLARRLKKKSKDDAFRVIGQPSNQGKGAALKAGVAASTGSWILTLDADMAVSPVQFLEWQEKHGVTIDPGSVSIGCRTHPASALNDLSLRKCMGRIFDFVVQLVSGLDCDDTQCGFKLYPAEAGKKLFAALKSSGWAHDVEVLLRARGAGMTIRSLPLAWHYVADSKSDRLKDAPVMFWNTVAISLRAWFGFKGDKDRAWRWATRFVLFAALVFYVSISSDFGISWDEPAQNRYGELVHSFYTSSGSDTSALTFGNLYLYGGLFDGMVAFFQKIIPVHPIGVRHLLTGLAAFLGIVGAARLARLAGGARAGLFCAVLLALEPNYLGHAFNNPKDIPFAALHVWTIYLIIRAIPTLPKIPSGLLFKVGLVMGMALGIRVGGAFLVGYLGLAMLVWALVCIIRRHCELSFRTVKAFLMSGIGVGVIAYVVMIAGWPWALHNPLVNPMLALTQMSQFNWVAPLLLNGKEYLPGDIPWTYLPHYFIVKLPIMFQISFLAGLVLVAAKGLFGKRSVVLSSLIIFSLVFPPTYVLIKGSTIYDGLRHFLFLIPVMAVLGGLALGHLTTRLNDRMKYGWAVSLLVLVVGLWPQINVMGQLHPYEYVYYNGLAGGVRGASGRYEMDYWGQSYGEAVRQLVQHVRKNEQAGEALSASYKVSAFGPKHTLLFYLPPGFEYCDVIEEADYVIAFTRFGVDKSVPGKTIGTVSRMGVDLSIIKQPRSE